MKIIPFEICMALTGAKVMQRGAGRGAREIKRWVHLPESVAPEFKIVYVDEIGVIWLTDEEGLYMPQPAVSRLESEQDLVLWVEDEAAERFDSDESWEASKAILEQREAACRR
jgi:hypothetical protein